LRQKRGGKMYLSIIIPSLLAFLTTLVATPHFIRILKLEGIVGIDIMKKNKPKIPEMGAPPIILGFTIGIFSYVFLQQYLIKTLPTQGLLYLMAAITTIILLSFIASLDELTTLMKKKEGKKGFEKYKRMGLSQISQPLLMSIAALPLIATGAGESVLHLPLLGSINIGIAYPLIIIPIAVLGAANATNMLAGFNGLTSGLGIVLMIFLSMYSYLFGAYSATIISIVFLATLLAFIIYNWYPAKIFPGGLDYLVGGVTAVVAIVGNIEKFALILFMPWFIELVLKMRSKFKAENFGVLQKDGTLKAPYKKIYSLTHLVMKAGKFKEWQVSLILIVSEFIWGIISLYLVKVI
jgi:UDP-N-acetylglucosamine--dolichyl-phosphate N-acetylglucosaminephosphotransferase